MQGLDIQELYIYNIMDPINHDPRIPSNRSIHPLLIIRELKITKIPLYRRTTMLQFEIMLIRPAQSQSRRSESRARGDGIRSNAQFADNADTISAVGASTTLGVVVVRVDLGYTGCVASDGTGV